ncbi:MAG: hypothetical protein ACKOOE_06345 [Micrococcales bacterium]|nr:hypothetical protein [Dermatophilaceae bacterium]NUR17323.1 hypothetical protein [Dermatophilaceae bacterium]
MSRTILRRALAAVSAVAAVAATLAVTTAAPASAAGTCSVNPPSRWTISSPFKTVNISVASDCAPGTHAAWDAITSKGPVDTLVFDGTRTEPFDMYDDDPLGRWTWRPAGCFSADFSQQCAQNTRTMDVRLGGWSGLTATRSGSRVTVTTSAARYAYSVDKFVPWTNVRGTVQYKAPTASTWTGLKYVYPASNGRYTFTYSTTSTRDYRVVFPDTSVVWGHTSATVRR